jgi:hypothetical protein
MSFNVRALITIAGRHFLPRPWSLASPFGIAKNVSWSKLLKQKTDDELLFLCRISPAICALRQCLLTPMKFIMCLMEAEVKAMSCDRL